MLRKLLSAAAGLGLAACATQQTPAQTAIPGDGRDCFRAADINGYSVIADRTLRVDVGANRRYALTTTSTLQGARSEIQLAVQADSGFICEGEALSVRIISLRQPSQTWQVTNIARLPDEAPVEGS
ncbi:MAG: DUF6491 family protein [Hyphomonadaceae bacterium]